MPAGEHRKGVQYFFAIRNIQKVKVAIKFLRENKHYNAKHFPKQWSLSGLDRILTKIDE